MSAEVMPYSLEELLKAIPASFDRIIEQASPLTEERIQLQINEKWSVGENIDHLVLSTIGVASSLARPKSFFATFGESDGPSRTYEVLYDTYFHLVAGRKAPAGLSPDADNPKGKAELMESFTTIRDKFAERLQAHWTEEELDQHCLPHPGFGRLTMREMLLFIIFHNDHHLKAIQSNLQAG